MPSTLSPLVSAVTVIIVASSLAEGYLYDGFSSASPADPYTAFYPNFYFNLPSVLPCTMTGNVYLSNPNEPGAVADPFSQMSGCLPGNSFEHYLLYPITLQEAATINSQFCGSGSDPAAFSKGLSGTLFTGLTGFVPANQGEIALVLAPPVADGNNASSMTPARYYNISCFLYLAPIISAVVPGTSVKGVYFGASTSDFRSMDLPSPLRRFSPYAQPANWIDSPTGQMWKGHNLTALYFPKDSYAATVDPDAQSWVTLVSRGYYNRDRIFSQSSGTLRNADPLYPRQVTETYMAMWSNEHPADKSPSYSDTTPSCLTQNDPFPTCLPIGGQSIWTTTALSVPSLPLPIPANYPRPNAMTGQNIAVLMESSSTAFIHDSVPAASTAATITAGLALVDALSPLLDTYFRGTGQSGNPQIYFFFLVGEEYGLAGSGQFIKEVRNFNCKRFPTQASTAMTCMFPYRKSTNFTSVDLSSFQHFLHLDQFGLRFNNGQLFQHVDSNLFANTLGPQRDISTKLEQQGIGVSVVGQIAPGPLFSFYLDSARRSSQSFTTIAPYDTSITAANANYRTPKDTPEHIDSAIILSQTQQVANVLATILGIPAGTLIVNASTVNTLWNCFGVDTGCPYFASYGFQVPGGTPPNYYPSVYSNYQQILQTQQFVRYFIRRKFRASTPVNSTCPCLKPEYQFCESGKCFNDYAFFHASFSASLQEVDGKAPLYFTQDLNYTWPGEIWVESSWGSALGARLAVQDSTAHGGAIFASGLIAIGLTLLACWLIEKVLAEKVKQP